MLYWFLLPLSIFLYYSAMAYYCLVHNLHKEIGPGAVTGFVCLWTAFCAGLALTNTNMMEVDGKRINYGRFLEWTINTPLLTGLLLDGYGVDPVHVYQSMVFSLSFCISGLIASLTRLVWLQVLLGVEGTVCAGVVLLHMFRVARDPVKKSRVATVNLVMTVLTWPLFVLAWGMGPDIYAVIDHKHEFVYETSLSLALKTTAVLYSLTDVEFDHLWEVPSCIFTTTRQAMSDFFLHR